MDGKDEIVTKPDAARRLGVSERTLDRLVSTDAGLKKVRISARRVGFRESDLSSFISRLGATK